MPRYQDLTGKRFGRWTVVKRGGRDRQGKNMWLCSCECGTEAEVRVTPLKSGTSLSCGCLARELSSERMTVHGMYGTPTHKSWDAMLHRCDNSNDPMYGYYGGRGITYTNRWKDFSNFYADMGERPSKQHSLDRIDPDKGYSPENCRWATPSEQARNRRDNTMLTLNNKSRCVGEWSERLKMHPATLFSRIRRGWSDHDVLTKPVMRKQPWQPDTCAEFPER